AQSFFTMKSQCSFAQPSPYTFRSYRRSLQCFEDSQKSLVVEPSHTIALPKPHALGSTHVPPNCFRIRTRRARYRLHPVAAQPLANNFSDFKHRDLSKCHRSSSAVGRLRTRASGSREGGNPSEKQASQTGECS